MDSVATYGSGNVRSKKPNKTRRSWTTHEEDVLIQALKEIITQGWKIDNGFRADYLNSLENAMNTAIPGTNLRGNPHINSKIHVWKKTHSTLVTLLSKSSVGHNDGENTVEATDETWEVSAKTDPSIRAMQHKRWTYLNDSSEILGDDRAVGDKSKNFENLLNEALRLDPEISNQHTRPENLTFEPLNLDEASISETHTPSSKPSAVATSKLKERKQPIDPEESLVAAINNLAHITKDTMSQLIDEMASKAKISDVQDQVLGALQGMKELSENEQLDAVELLFNNHNDLALFQRLNERGRIFLVKGLLWGE